MENLNPEQKDNSYIQIPAQLFDVLPNQITEH